MDQTPGGRVAAVLVLIGFLVLAAALRLHRLSEQDYWLDESIALVTSAGHYAQMAALPYGTILPKPPQLTRLNSQSSFAGVWECQKHDIHPPIYFVLLRWWRQCWGDSEFALRLLSVVFSVLSLIVIYDLLRALAGPFLGTCGVALCAVGFSHLAQAQQVRPYSLLVLLLCVSLRLVVFIETKWSAWPNSKRFQCIVVYIITMALGLWTHYLFLLPLIAQLIYIMVRFRRALRIACASGLVTATAGFIVGQPQGMAERFRQPGRTGWMVEESVTHGRDTLLRAAALPMHLFIHTGGSNVDWRKALIGLGGLGLCLVGIWRRIHGGPLLFVLTFFVPVLALTTIDFLTGTGSLGHLRYPFVGFVGLLGIVVFALAMLPRVAQIVAVSFIIIVCMVTLDYPTRTNPEARALGEYLKARAAPGDLLMIDGRSTPIWFTETLYVRIAHYVDDLPCSVLVLRDPLDSEVRSTLREFNRWFVIRGQTDAFDESLFPPARLVDVSRIFGGVGPIHVLRPESGDSASQN